MHRYPDALPAPPPRQFAAFLWECSRGARPYLALETFCTAAIGAFEALLFSMMAHGAVVPGRVQPAVPWHEHGNALIEAIGIVKHMGNGSSSSASLREVGLTLPRAS